MLPQAICNRSNKINAPLATGNWFAIVLALVSTLPGLAAHADTQRVRRYAAFAETHLDTSADTTASSSSTNSERRRIRVEGRSLTLALQDNSEMLGGVPRSFRHLQMQQGRLEGKPGSWVRLTRSSQGVNGLIWDGQQMYVVASATSVGSSETGSVIYKLSDASIDLPANYCGDSSDMARATDGAQAYAAVVNELAGSAATAGAATEASLRLEMQVLADAAFRANYASDEDAVAALMTRINNVDGIFRNQLGLAVQATNIQFLRDDGTTSLTGSTDANTLLASLSQVRTSSAVMGTYPLTHLVTGRDLDGDTLGISYIGQLCGSRYGVSLSEVRARGVWIDSLVMAHELGHLMGAVHDGTGACVSADSQAYLMSSNINGASEFSACSKQKIASTMAAAACLVPADLPLQSSTVTQSAAESPASEAGGGAIDWAVLSALVMLLIVRSSANSTPHPATAPDRK